MAGCCIFYLLWWILAFRPSGAVKGFKSGWLLIPALFLGIFSVVMIIRGVNETEPALFSPGTVVLAGIAVYVALLFLTGYVFHRQVTTELFLIIGWAVLTFLEINALYGSGITGRQGALILLALVLIAAAVCMACYMLYYKLDGKAGYVDGMIPLVLAGLFMLALSVLIIRSGQQL